MDIHHGYSPWKEHGGTETKFGHADYHAALAQGKSAGEIANWARANTDKMGNKGVGGMLWKTIMAADEAANKKIAGGPGGGGGGGGGGHIAPTPPSGGDDIYNNPADKPYFSSYESPQHGYMNEPSSLTPEELNYMKGNIKGLDDRQDTIENPGALLNEYVFNINRALKDRQIAIDAGVGSRPGPSTSIVRIGGLDPSPVNTPSNKPYKRQVVGPYDRYDTSNYY